MTKDTIEMDIEGRAHLVVDMLGEVIDKIDSDSSGSFDNPTVSLLIRNAEELLGSGELLYSSATGRQTKISLSMASLDRALELIRDMGQNDPSIADAAEKIAKTLALLYPISKGRQSHSVLPEVPNADPPAHDERRASPRVPIETEIGFQSETNFYTGFSENISSGGLFLSTYDIRPVGSTLTVSFALPNGQLVCADGIVRWVREYNATTPDTPPGMGVQFGSLGSGDEMAINRFLKQRQPMFFE